MSVEGLCQFKCCLSSFLYLGHLSSKGVCMQYLEKQEVLQDAFEMTSYCTARINLNMMLSEESSATYIYHQQG